MQCEDLIIYLSDYIDGNLNDELISAAQEHLATCHNCSVVLDSTQKTIALYRENGRKQQIPADRHKRLYDEIAAVFAKKQPK